MGVQKVVEIQGPRWTVRLGNCEPLSLILGPCVIESLAHAMDTARAIDECLRTFPIRWIFKSSFDKANRTSHSGFRGPGMDKGLEILAEVRDKVGCPVLTDVHEVAQCEPVARVVDVLQVPAFLCRQTDLVEAAARTGKPVNMKKGQFLAPWDMAPVLGKLEAAGGSKLMLTERGTTFGYNNLVVDYRSMAIMKGSGYPVVFDATHSVQLPGAGGVKSSGERCFVPVLARAAAAVGVAAIFMETHLEPDKAPSDGPNMIPVRDLVEVVAVCAAMDETVKTLARNAGL